MRLSLLAACATTLLASACAAGTDDDTIDSPRIGESPTASADAAAHGSPITGRTHDVRMLFDGSRYHFEPERLSIRQGDGVRWIMVSGAPHNVEFVPAEIPAGADSALARNMPRTDAPLMGPMLLSENEQYLVSFADVPRGSYGYICTPHQMMGMKGTIEVQ